MVLIVLLSQRPDSDANHGNKAFRKWMDGIQTVETQNLRAPPSIR